MALLRRFRRLSRNLPLIPTVVLMIVLVAAGVWFFYFHNHKIVSTIPSTRLPAATASSPDKYSGNSSTSTQSSSSASKSLSGSASNGPAPAAPTGYFVSNHHPSSSTSLSEASICVTTPGASCYIQFSKDNILKTLQSQVAVDGTASWNWNIHDAGLTTGNWQVKAIATLNGQTQTTTDSLELVVP